MDSSFVVVCDGGATNHGEQFSVCVDPSGNVVSHTGGLTDVDYAEFCDWHLSGSRTSG
jgi:hypothetical protein